MCTMWMLYGAYGACIAYVGDQKLLHASRACVDDVFLSGAYGAYMGNQQSIRALHGYVDDVIFFPAPPAPAAPTWVTNQLSALRAPTWTM